MTELIYLTDNYIKEIKATVVSCEKKGDHWKIVLDKTIFYPEGGGQPSDKGEIIGKNGKAHVKHVRLKGDIVIHEATLEGTLQDNVTGSINWDIRYQNMRVHSAGHIVHEAVKLVSPSLTPVKGEHTSHPFIEYEGSLTIDKKYAIEKKANEIVSQNVSLKTEFVTLEELMKRAPWVPEHLPKNKPLRILTVGTYPPIPDGGTQVATSGEVGPITIDEVENADNHVRVYYQIATPEIIAATPAETLSSAQLTGILLDTQKEAIETIAASTLPPDQLRLEVLGSKSDFAKAARQMTQVPATDRQSVGIVINQVKKTIEEALEKGIRDKRQETSNEWIDTTLPGIKPPEGHLHIVTQAISEITRIFERVGFTRVRHPEVDWDWYAFESLNMPANHPARDEWETFFIDYTGKRKMVLTPHTSNGQVREMEKKHLPIRMINIAKCYRRQIDVSHTPMFHQFEGLYVDKNVSISHLKGVFDYFVKQFFGPERQTRLRPFHFQFTEPSFEVDITCGICLGKGCRLCKAGWLELGGAGMVHPNVLKTGGIDPNIYSGFAFGWGIERTSMMKSGTKLDDIRLLYSNDVRFLEQF